MEGIQDLESILIGKDMHPDDAEFIRVISSVDFDLLGFVRYFYKNDKCSSSSFSKSFIDTYLSHGKIYFFKGVAYLLTIKDLQYDGFYYFVHLEAI